MSRAYTITKRLQSINESYRNTRNDSNNLFNDYKEWRDELASIYGSDVGYNHDENGVVSATYKGKEVGSFKADKDNSLIGAGVIIKKISETKSGTADFKGNINEALVPFKVYTERNGGDFKYFDSFINFEQATKEIERAETKQPDRIDGCDFIAIKDNTTYVYAGDQWNHEPSMNKEYIDKAKKVK